jgi:hypothetical protein
MQQFFARVRRATFWPGSSRTLLAVPLSFERVT